MYTTLEQLKGHIGKDTFVDDYVLEDLRSAAEQSVDWFCGRSFALVDAGADPTSRLYVPLGGVVFCDDIADSTGLVVVDNGTTLTSDQYQLEPVNQLGSDRQYRPISMIRRLGCWSSNGYPGQATVTVTTARWGWTSLPTPVSIGTRMAAKDLWDGREARFGTAGFGEFGPVRIRENSQTALVLRPYRSHSPGDLPGMA